MRIIAGANRGRTLQGPPDSGVRPTSDALRETLFNILGPSVRGATLLDAFAGTGAVGLEAISRGAAQVTFVERDPRAIRVLKENIRRCGAENACAIVIRDVLAKGTIPGTFDVVFLDPPYDTVDLDGALAAGAKAAAPGGRLILEHSRRREAPVDVEAFRRARVVIAGDSALSFYVGT
jgi:16S rRNA (guanine(966)-N(2))-methyltransferase RsmD